MWPAIVTLKHGDEAECAVSQLYGVPLLGADVQISLYRGDNLLCVTALPSTLCVDDSTFKTFVETFGPVEKCFLMRYPDGLYCSLVTVYDWSDNVKFLSFFTTVVYCCCCYYCLSFHSLISSIASKLKSYAFAVATFRVWNKLLLTVTNVLSLASFNKLL